ncbi:MAG: response regulator [Chitinivibrionales bacterium]|nr:response regulator [Chitinivibrionales bacterium]
MTTAANRLLLVDDEEAIVFAFSQLLKAPNLQIDTATSLQDAVNHLKNNNYSAVIADLRLSGSTNLEGYDVIREARATQADCIIIIVTAYGGEDTAKTVSQLGADYYFEKPVSPKTIKDLLKSKAVYP